MKFSVIIPTYNREKDLIECIQSIIEQTTLPKELIIIDDGSLPSDFVRKQKDRIQEKDIEFSYYKKNKGIEREGLSESKNTGLNLAKGEIIFFLDDDIVLQKDFLKKIIRIWEERKADKKLIGVGGWIENIRRQSIFEKFYNIIFGLSSRNPWDINEVGFQVWNSDLKDVIKCYYIHGGLASYRKELIKKMGGFKTFEGGRTALEDVEFCLRAKKEGYYFILTPFARAAHKQSLIARENEFLMGLKECKNRKIIFSLHCKKDFWHKIWFCWANIGWILRQFLSGHFQKGLGMIKGFIFENK